MRVEHDWQLIKTPAHPQIGISPFHVWWECSRCGYKVNVTEKQIKWNSFRRPNKRRKFGGLFCGELMIRDIHES